MKDFMPRIFRLNPALKRLVLNNEFEYSEEINYYPKILEELDAINIVIDKQLPSNSFEWLKGVFQRFYGILSYYGQFDKGILEKNLKLFIENRFLLENCNNRHDLKKILKKRNIKMGKQDFEDFDGLILGVHQNLKTIIFNTLQSEQAIIVEDMKFICKIRMEKGCLRSKAIYHFLDPQEDKFFYFCDKE